MRGSPALVAGALLTFFACGEPPAPKREPLPLPDYLLLPCDRPFDSVQAWLRVSGHEARCPMSVDFKERTVGGSCPGVVTGLSRSVALEYEVRYEGYSLLLSQQFGEVNLTELSVGETERSVTLGRAVATQRCVGRLEPAEVNLSLCDDDGDGVTNLEEYCRIELDPRRVEEPGE